MDEKERTELKEELHELKKRIEHIDKRIDKDDKKEEEKRLKIKEQLKTPEKTKYIRILVILVIIILVLDILSIIAYYKPDFSSILKRNTSPNTDVDNNKNNNTKTSAKICSDGTPYDECSKTKPKYCYNGDLVDKAASCGCPAGLKKDFQDCVKI